MSHKNLTALNIHKYQWNWLSVWTLGERKTDIRALNPLKSTTENVTPKLKPKNLVIETKDNKTYYLLVTLR